MGTENCYVHTYILHEREREKCFLAWASGANEVKEDNVAVKESFVNCLL